MAIDGAIRRLNDIATSMENPIAAGKCFQPTDSAGGTQGPGEKADLNPKA